MLKQFFLFSCSLPVSISILSPTSSAFILPSSSLSSSSSSKNKTTTSIHSTSNSNSPSMSTSLVDPSQRDEQYGSNIARYLLDLHDNRGTFDFCGGMMFQLMLTDQLYAHLSQLASASDTDTDRDIDGQSQSQVNVKVYDATKSRMFHLPHYSKCADADNISIFHGRELRNIPHAAGGFGFVLQLSMAYDNAADARDPEGWSHEEISTYDGWGHDVGRTWRKAEDYEREGYGGFKDMFGNKAFGLNHRFYFHLDGGNRIWLSAEDGCEGTPAIANSAGAGGNPIRNLFGL